MSLRTRHILFLSALLGALLGFSARAASPGSPLHEPPSRARVWQVHDPASMLAYNAIPERITEMVNRGVRSVTGERTLTAAWRSLVSTNDVVGIKIYASPGATSGTRAPVVAAVIQGLIAAGVPPKQIVIWDKHLGELRLAGYFELAESLGVQVAGSAEEGYDENVFYETALLGKLVWGDFEFGRKGDGIGRKSFVSKLVSQKLTKIINITPLLNHNLAGVSGNLYGLGFGSVDNIIRLEGSPTHLANAIPELYAMEAIGDKVVLSIVDGLICQYQGEEKMMLHYSTMLGELRFSKDPVALDVLSILELENQRQAAKIPLAKPDMKIYSNATLLELGVSDRTKIDLLPVK